MEKKSYLIHNVTDLVDMGSIVGGEERTGREKSHDKKRKRETEYKTREIGNLVGSSYQARTW